MTGEEPTVTLPADCRQWPYRPIVMPVDELGRGPCGRAETDRLTWEVWDDACVSHGSFEYLADAINEAMRLSAEELGRRRRDG